MILNTSQIQIIMKYFNILILFSALFFFSCAEKYKEISPVSNTDSIKVKLEISDVKSSKNGRAEFCLRFINSGQRDLGRCVIKLDNKYEHQLEGLFCKTEDWEGKPQISMIKTGESATIVFEKDLDNYSIFGIKDENFGLPETIELICLDGKVTWKTK